MRMQLSYSLVLALVVAGGASDTRSLAGEQGTPRTSIGPLDTAAGVMSEVGPDLEGLTQLATAGSSSGIESGVSEIAQADYTWVSGATLAHIRAGEADALNVVRKSLAKLGKLNSAPNVALRRVGACQFGAAAWYGGRYIGRATTSGSRLDVEHATAAHRTLPLNSLARVTRLDNGRSVVVRITDRGPVSHELLIDMSPKAADQLDMKDAGVVRVAVEQVVEIPSTER
jgi:rare lipoprotein A (peptidoglycan hydrolase)